MAAGYDIIGDVHGEATVLEALLDRLGYIEINGVYQHVDGDRQAIFVGDFVDRGQENLRSVEIVQGMVESGSAKAVLGNHEIGHIRYATQGADGNYLWPHNHHSDRSLKEFFDEIPFGSDKHQEVIEWFKSLPVYLETEDFIVAHASHESKSVGHMWEYLDRDQVLCESAYESFNLDRTFRSAAYNMLFGPDVKLPEDIKEKLEEHALETTGRLGYHASRRFYWWREGDDISPAEMLGLDHLDLTEDQHMKLSEILDAHIEQDDGLLDHSKPIVFGHYALMTEPHLTSDDAVCLDFSGHLTAYRYNEGDSGQFFDDRLVSIPLDDKHALDHAADTGLDDVTLDG